MRSLPRVPHDEDMLYNTHPEAQILNGGLNEIRAISPQTRRWTSIEKLADNTWPQMK